MKFGLLLSIVIFFGLRGYGQSSVDEYLQTLKEDTSAIELSADKDDIYWHSLSLPSLINERQNKLFEKNQMQGILRAQKYLTKALFDTIRTFILLPDLNNFLYQPLSHNGLLIQIEKHKMANGRMGVATCREEKLKIVLPTKVDPRVPIEGMIFFIEHEFAHIKLGHASCTRISMDDRINKEKAADWEAVKSILSKKGGESIVLQVLGILGALNIPSSASHPSSKERRNFIMKDFGQFRSEQRSVR